MFLAADAALSEQQEGGSLGGPAEHARLCHCIREEGHNNGWHNYKMIHVHCK